MKKTKIMPVFGTRPEAIKMAPLIKALDCDEHFVVRTVVTAQHRKMLDQVLDLFRIKPFYDLDIMEEEQTLTDITVKVLEGLGKIIAAEKPDMVLVHGDTTTTFAAGLAAFYEQVPVGHVEAGLRIHDKYAPYPEEMNRKLTGCIADLHFAPTETACASLLKEGINPGCIFITGNTVIDALLLTYKKQYRFKNKHLQQIDFLRKKAVLLTCHRRENLGASMRNIFRAVRRIAATHDDVEVIFPAHPNPRVREVLVETLQGLERVHIIEPLDYESFANLMGRCRLVLTDSGGIQEEAPALGIPVLVLRDITERPEAVQAGTVRLIGMKEEVVFHETERLLTDSSAYGKMANAVNPYGDGKAANRIMQALLFYFKYSTQRPEQWKSKI
ncbi:MAG: non-hydrolyzing UDP-N-acetylglucosamine 2-epimerase [Bacillota bacterium]